MKRIKTFPITLIIIVLVSCSNFYGDENLGSGYFVWKDGRYKDIIYSENKSKVEGGYSVIRKNVVNVKYNENYIIVKTYDTQSSGDNLVEYWIIDKTVLINMSDCNSQESCDELLRSNVTGPLDSLNFSFVLEKKNIPISFGH